MFNSCDKNIRKPGGEMTYHAPENPNEHSDLQKRYHLDGSPLVSTKKVRQSGPERLPRK
jgi:hypothetical protein